MPTVNSLLRLLSPTPPLSLLSTVNSLLMALVGQLDYFSTVLEPFASQTLENIVDQLRDMLRQRTMESIQSFPGESDPPERGLRRLNRLGGPDLRAERAPYDDGGLPDSMPQNPEELKVMSISLPSYRLLFPNAFSTPPFHLSTWLTVSAQIFSLESCAEPKSMSTASKGGRNLSHI